MNMEEWSILLPAMLAGVLVLITHVPLGREVLQRGIIFIDLAIAQIAGLGILLVSWLGVEENPWLFRLAAVVSALLGAWGIGWLEKRFAHLQEALIGVSFVLAATGSILLLSGTAHAGEALKDLLVGQILWVTYDQLGPLLVFSALILLLWNLFPGKRQRLFYPLFALAVTSSVQLVGVYLVFASLILPALGSRAYAAGRQMGVGLVIGALGYVVGLMVSARLDLPGGAVVVWMIALFALLAAWLGGRLTAFENRQQSLQ